MIKISDQERKAVKEKEIANSKRTIITPCGCVCSGGTSEDELKKQADANATKVSESSK